MSAPIDTELPAQSKAEQEAPPVGERIHMPESSILPVINAAGLSIAIIGIPISPTIILAGLAVFAVTTGIWVRDARREYQELPLESHDH